MQLCGCLQQVNICCVCRWHFCWDKDWSWH